MLALLAKAGDRIGGAWCHALHPAPMWPVAGYYICPLCQRRHRVKFELPLEPAPREHARPASAAVTAARVHAEARS